MLANCCDVPFMAALFRGTPPFNSGAWTATGANKFDLYDEEGWTKLPNGRVLTVDAYVFIEGSCDTNSEMYNAGAPARGRAPAARSFSSRTATLRRGATSWGRRRCGPTQIPS